MTSALGQHPRPYRTLCACPPCLNNCTVGLSGLEHHSHERGLVVRTKGYKGCCWMCSANAKWKGSGAERVPFKVKRALGQKRRLRKRPAR